MNPYLDFEDELNYYDIFFERTDNKISTLSRQLRTLTKVIEATNGVISINLRKSPDISSISSIEQWKRELNLCYFEYNNYLEKNVGENEDLKLKLLMLEKNAMLNPKSQEVSAFRNFLKKKIDLWNSIHILSELEIYRSPELLKRVITILTILCDHEAKLNEKMPECFKQLKLNYKQIDHEYGINFRVNERKQNKLKAFKERELTG